MKVLLMMMTILKLPSKLEMKIACMTGKFQILNSFFRNFAKTERRLTLAEYKAIVKEEENEEDEEVPFSEKSTAGKILFILCFPLDFISFITIPPVELEKLDKPWIGIYSLTSFAAVLFLNGCKNLNFFEKNSQKKK